MPYNYHQPSASGGKLIHSGHQLYSPKDAIEFRFEDIIIEIYGQNNWISIGIYVPEHNIVQLSSDFIWIYENNSKDMQKFQFDHAVYNIMTAVKTLALMQPIRLLGERRDVINLG